MKLRTSLNVNSSRPTKDQSYPKDQEDGEVILRSITAPEHKIDKKGINLRSPSEKIRDRDHHLIKEYGADESIIS